MASRKIGPVHKKADRTGPFILGRAATEKIQAVEGIVTNDASRAMFAEFDKQGLSADERRKAMIAKYTKTPDGD